MLPSGNMLKEIRGMDIGLTYHLVLVYFLLEGFLIGMKNKSLDA